MNIAKALHISEGAVRARLKKLEQKKIILRYSVFLDTALLGMRYFKLHFHIKNITKPFISQVRAFAHLHPNIIYSNTAIGGHFLEFDLNVTSQDQLYEIIDVFREQFTDNIREYEFIEYTKEHKFEYLPGTP